jgi:hypothetical protein
MADIARPYVIVIAATHPRTGETSEHRVALEAYSIQDVIHQALVELDAKHSFMEQQYKLKVLSVGPDTERSAEQLTTLLSEIGLLRMPSQGKQ